MHIHFKIRNGPDMRPGFDFTSQLYFEDAISERVFERAPYAVRGALGTPNARDGGYRSGGERLLLGLRETESGYAARFDVGLQLS